MQRSNRIVGLHPARGQTEKRDAIGVLDLKAALVRTVRCKPRQPGIGVENRDWLQKRARGEALGAGLARANVDRVREAGNAPDGNGDGDGAVLNYVQRCRLEANLPVRALDLHVGAAAESETR